MKFLGGVEVTQGSDRLKSDRLVVNFSDEDRVIHRAQALDNVDLVDERGHPGAGHDRRHHGQRRPPSHLPPPRPVAASRPHAAAGGGGAGRGPHDDAGAERPARAQAPALGRARLRVRRQGQAGGADRAEGHPVHHGSDPAGQGRPADPRVQALRGQDRPRHRPGHDHRVHEGRVVRARPPEGHLAARAVRREPRRR